MSEQGFKIESGVRTGKSILAGMFGGSKPAKRPTTRKKVVKNEDSATPSTSKPKKSAQNGSKEAKIEKKSQFKGNYRDFVKKRASEGERDFKVIGKEWQDMKGAE